MIAHIGVRLSSRRSQLLPHGATFDRNACSHQARCVTVKAADDTPTLRNKDIVAAVANDLMMEEDDVKLVVDHVWHTVQEVVAGGSKVTITGFGSFKRTETAAREGRNPKTGDPLHIEASARPTFTAGKVFKTRVKSKYHTSD